jgi:hypothetical protein
MGSGEDLNRIWRGFGEGLDMGLSVFWIGSCAWFGVLDVGLVVGCCLEVILAVAAVFPLFLHCRRFVFARAPRRWFYVPVASLSRLSLFLCSQSFILIPGGAGSLSPCLMFLSSYIQIC